MSEESIGEFYARISRNSTRLDNLLKRYSIGRATFNINQSRDSSEKSLEIKIARYGDEFELYMDNGKIIEEKTKLPKTFELGEIALRLTGEEQDSAGNSKINYKHIHPVIKREIFIPIIINMLISRIGSEYFNKHLEHALEDKRVEHELSFKLSKVLEELLQ